MADLMSTMTTAISLARRLREINKNIEDAEFKNILADLSLELADVKLALADIQVKGIEKDKEIDFLKEKLKNKTIGFLGARYYLGENGEPTGSPFCPTCYAKDHELYPLTNWNSRADTNKCGVCGNTVDQRQSPIDVDHYIKRQSEASGKMGTAYEPKFLP